jgi:hypothetical protein
MKNNTTPISRSTEIVLDSAIAKVLLENQAQIREITSIRQTLIISDQKLISALVANAGFDIQKFERWEYKDGKNGKTLLVLVPPPAQPPTVERPNVKPPEE